MKTAVLEEMPASFWQELERDNLRNWFVPEVDYSAEIAIIRTKTQFDRELLDKFENLKLIIRAGSGFDNIAVRYAEQKDIIVCNTPEANAFSAYEHTLAQILALIKNLQLGKNEIQSERWKTEHSDNWEIADLKVLVVGLGKVGTRVAQAMEFLGAKVKAVDPYLSSQQWQNRAIDPIHYIEGLNWCNLVTFHCPLYRETVGYFDKTILQKISQPIWLVNSARGKIVEFAALEEGLKSHKLLGVALDVFETEPATSRQLFNDPRVVITPHTGAYTQAAKDRMSRETIEVWKSFVQQGVVLNQVDKKFIF